MLISYKHKFIFIHNYKVAGTSIKKALKPYGFITPLRFNMLNKVTENFNSLKFINQVLATKTKFLPSYHSHARAIDLKRQIPELIWSDFFKFGFVRNPWDWQVSLFHYMKQIGSHYQTELLKNINSFDEYVDWRVNKDLHLQKEYFFDEQGNNLVDYIGKLENINEDFNKICQDIGINAKLPFVNSSKHKNYRSYYTDKTRALIEKHFREDIELFKYSF